MIADSAVTTAKINDESVTVAKLDPSINFFPSGGIVMWSGTIADIPTDWVLCDGQNGTPDLRNRFIVGAHSGTNPGTTSQAGPGFSIITGAIADDYEPGDTGGETAHQLSVNELPAHNHSYQLRSIYQQGSGPNAQTDMANNGNAAETGNEGSNRYHENRPPYYALAYIMKT